MLFCVAGETARGKDTFVRYVEKKYDLKPVCSYTTRAPRQKEKNGIEHYFISEDTADLMLANLKDEIVVPTKIGNVRYFSTIHELESSDIFIIEPEGIRCLREEHKELDLCVIYITCSEEICLERSKRRGDTAFMDRAKAESRRFQEFASNKEYDYMYVNDGSVKDLQAFADRVMQELGIIQGGKV